MSLEQVITVENISKTYKLYHSHRDRMKEWLHPLRKCYHTKHDALKNVSLTVGKGEVLGVIGQNGSGKSTLLKILSSVVTQNSGSFECNGRVSALLELGGGFNMDLTGVENVFFLGAIQGYSKKEMSARLKQILDFAEIGEYAQQPVKNYSSGMYVRLAFSISINIDPEILIVDEALSVGDMRFQQKCFRKIKEIKDSGKTIVFCSHSLSAVKDFCTRAIWINHGEIAEEGDPHTVCEKYQIYMAQNGASVQEIAVDKLQETESGMPNFLLKPELKHLIWTDMRKYQANGMGEAQILYTTIIALETGGRVEILKGGDHIRLVCVVVAEEPLSNPGFQMILNGQFSNAVFNINTYHYNQQISIATEQPGLIAVDFVIPDLGNGNYSLSLALTNVVDGLLTYVFRIYDAMIINIENEDVRYKTGTQMVVKDARIFTINPSEILNR